MKSSGKGVRDPGGRKGADPVGDLDALAAEALAFLAQDSERLSRFLAVTGLGPGSLRQAAAEPGFTRGILAYVAQDEPLLTEFAAARSLHPEALAQAIARLEGGWVDP